MTKISILPAALLCSLLFWVEPASSVAQEIEIQRLNLADNASSICPVLRDSTLYFASNRKWSIGKTYVDQRGQHPYQIYSVPIKNRQPDGRPKPIYSNGRQGYNMLSVSFGTEGQAYISQNDMSTSALRGAPLEIRVYPDENSESVKLQGLPEKCSNGMPAIAPDGSFLVFASDALGGEGRVDLYYCPRSSFGWGEPVNMGAEVNTPGIETAPFIHPSGKIFFSSDGRDDSQGLSIYYTYRAEDGSFATPQKFDEEVSSMRDDYGLWYSDDEKWGYLTSNRDGRDNIYYFHRTFPTFDHADSLQNLQLCYTLYEASAENYDTTEFTCKWAFGDGQFATGLEVEHCYDGVGTYDIELSVLDKTSGEEMFSLAQYQLDIQKPEQVGILYPKHIKAGEPVTFIANTDGLPDFRPREFYWDMGNGDKVKGQSATTVFNKKGTYRVQCGTIDARNDNDRRASWTLVTVE